MPLLSIVIPVFNNAESLDTLIENIERSLAGSLSYELILVNDGSADASWEIIENNIRKRTSPNPVTAIDLKENYGQENAKMAGLKKASGEYVVFMDADCQHDPEHIPALLEECKKGADVCYANFSNSPVSLFKRAGSAFYNYLACRLLQKPKGIYLSSYNIIRKQVADKARLHESPIVNIDAIVLQETQQVTQIFVEQKQSLNKKTNYTPLKMAALFFKLLPGFSILPLRIILFAGTILLISGITLTAVKIIFHFADPSVHILGTLKLLVITIGGAILTSIGILGEYAGKIYIMLSNSRQFEIRTMISSDANEKK